MRHRLVGSLSLSLLGLLVPILARDQDQATAPLPPSVAAIPEAERGEGVSLTVYNQNFVMVKERRRVNLLRGRQTLRFPDVAATIVPETVQFSTFNPDQAARVIEQNYEFDLVSAERLLDKYLDHPVGLVTRDGSLRKGRLLSFDAKQFVLDTGGSIDLLPRGKNIKDIQFATLPGGLLSRPTLVWQIESRVTGSNLVKVSYRADQMTWNVTYTARSRAVGDTMDLAGWVTITNNTGTTFRDAQLKLMAGDIHVVQERPATPRPPSGGSIQATEGQKGFTEKSFAEYHLYELGKTATIKSQEVKQLELMDVAGIPVTRGYSYNGTADGNKVAVNLAFKNSKETHPKLGVPLPKGPIRVYLPDADGEMEFLGTDEVDHTPKDEQVRVRLGYTLDVTGERRLLGQRRPSPNVSQYDLEVRLRNHTDQEVTVDVIEPIMGHQNAEILRHSRPFKKPNVNTLVFPISVRPHAEVAMTYTVQYSW
jgi:hypothetical protein